MPVWKVADAFAPAVALGQAFGRQGCFAAALLLGKGNASAVGSAFYRTRPEYTGVPVFYPDGSDLYLTRRSFTNRSSCWRLWLSVYFHRHKKFGRPDPDRLRHTFTLSFGSQSNSAAMIRGATYWASRI